jgi:hypothetical protein
MKDKGADPTTRANAICRRFGLSGCARDFFTASADPFSSPPGCMPVNMMNPSSHKLKLHAEGSFTTGTDKTYAYVLLNPYNWMSTTNTANRASITTSTSAYLGYSPDRLTTAVGVQAVQFAGPYTAAQFGGSNGLKYRVVAAALAVQNVGARLNKEGTYFGLCEPDHATVHTFSTAVISSYDEVSIMGEEQIDGWFTVKSNGPSEEADFGYRADDPDSPYMCIVVNCSGANAQNFRFRAVVHVEVIGREVRSKTPTHSDPQATSLAASALKHAQATCGKDDHSSSSWWGSLESAVGKGVSALSSLGKGIMSLPGPSMAVKELPMLIGAVTGGGASRAKIAGSAVSSAPRITGRPSPAAIAGPPRVAMIQARR